MEDSKKLHLTVDMGVGLGVEIFTFKLSGTNTVFCKLELYLSSFGASQCKVFDSQNKFAGVVSFVYGSWTDAERLQTLKDIMANWKGEAPIQVDWSTMGKSSQ